MDVPGFCLEVEKVKLSEINVLYGSFPGLECYVANRRMLYVSVSL